MSPKSKESFEKILLLSERILDAMKATLKVKITLLLSSTDWGVAFKATVEVHRNLLLKSVANGKKTFTK